MVITLQSTDPGDRVVEGRSLAGIVGSSPAGGMDGCLVSVVLCQVEVLRRVYHSSRGVLSNACV